MGILVSSPCSQPEVVFDRVHLVRLEISQPIVFDDSLRPVFRVQIEYRLYGVADGRRHYHSETREILIEDYLSAAAAAMSAGDLVMYGAMQSIEAAVATIIAKDLGITATVI